MLANCLQWDLGYRRYRWVYLRVYGWLLADGYGLLTTYHQSLASGQ